ncbi:hypothetical protein D3C87_1429470 [compost metagenome]
MVPTWPGPWTTLSETAPRSSTCRSAGRARWALRSRPRCSVRSMPASSSPWRQAMRPEPTPNGRAATPAIRASPAGSSSRAPTTAPIRSPASPTAPEGRRPGSCRRPGFRSTPTAKATHAGSPTALPSPRPPWRAPWPCCSRPSPICRARRRWRSCCEPDATPGMREPISSMGAACWTSPRPSSLSARRPRLRPQDGR